MSIAAINWAWSQQAPTSTAKLVLVALADHANAEGECWPSMGSVASLAQCSTRQVSRCVDALEDAGLLTRKRRRLTAGKLGGYVYKLTLTTGHTRPLDTDVQLPPASTGHLRQVVTDDHRTPEAPTTGHPRPQPPDTHVRTEPPKSNRQGTTKLFERFWQAYPKRDGIRSGKKQALDQWKKLADADRDLAMIAVEHYRVAAEDPSVFCPVRDAWRWLRDRLFEDWQERAVGQPRDGPKGPTRPLDGDVDYTAGWGREAGA